MKGKQYEEKKAVRRSISMPKWIWDILDGAASDKKERVSEWFQRVVKKELKIKQ